MLRMAFPERPRGSASYFPSVTPDCHLYGGVTDGDFTMWKRHILHVPGRHYKMLALDPMKAMGLRYCDRHKGDRIRKSGVAAYKKQQEFRKINAKDYDKEHALGALLQRPWRDNFEHLTEVIRAHPHPGVCEVVFRNQSAESKRHGPLRNAERRRKEPRPQLRTNGSFRSELFCVEGFVCSEALPL